MNLMNLYLVIMNSLKRRHNARHGVSNHQQLDGLYNYLFTLTSKKTSKSALPALCEGNPPDTGGFPPQRASNAVSGGFPSQRDSNAESLSIAWRHNVYDFPYTASNQSVRHNNINGFKWNPRDTHNRLMSRTGA